ncbi:MAG: triose-phosphate isomerase [Simkaniaceae bacterium]|nr:triose-phosphate isomerase [Simkaniaceae bacterium]
MRGIHLIGNWKMHKTREEAENFFAQLRSIIDCEQAGVGFAVPYTAIHASFASVLGTKIAIGAQSVSEHVSGAFTGEISTAMIHDVGASFVLVGHSERRHVFGETDEVINRKLKRAQGDGLAVVLCVGETLEQRENGKIRETIQKQLEMGLAGEVDRDVIIAYEPVWAIGTGEVATPAVANEIHWFCREVLNERFGPGSGDQTPILYGGSVSPDNIEDLIKMPEIDGCLIGGASLAAEKFGKIVNIARSTTS